MVIKVYTSGISGNKEVKKRQQRILMILESKNIKYETIDITEPGKEADKLFMQEHAEAKDSKHPLPPQIFNEDDYCGDYDGFDLANENDELEIFLKMPIPGPNIVNGAPKITTQEEIVERSVHGFCYTPALAKRLEKVIRASLRKSKDHSKIHGYCYTPAFAERLTKYIIKSHEMAVKRSITPSPQPIDVDEDDMEEDNQELDSSVKEDDEMDQETKSEIEDGAEGEE